MCRCITRDYRGRAHLPPTSVPEQQRLGSKTSQNDVFCSRSLTGSIICQSGPPCESIEIPHFCSRSLLGSILSKSCFSHPSKAPSKKVTICKTGTSENPQLLIAYSSVRAPQKQLPKLRF